MFCLYNFGIEQSSTRQLVASGESEGLLSSVLVETMKELSTDNSELKLRIEALEKK